jgi:hypothetical protein
MFKKKEAEVICGWVGKSKDCCCLLLVNSFTLVAKAEGNWGTQRKGEISRFKPLPSNG